MAQTTSGISEILKSSIGDMSREMNRQITGDPIIFSTKKGLTMTAKEHETEAKRLRAQEKNRKQSAKRFKRYEAQRDLSREAAMLALTKAAGKGDTKAAAALLRWM